MEKKSLKDLLPQESEITLNNKTYHLRPVNADDWAWMEAKWSDPAKKLKGLTILELCMILFRLLKEKEDFLPVEIESYDDDGNPFKEKLTAPRQLAIALQGFDAISQATQAFERALGVEDVSEEDIEKLQEQAQKKIQKRKVKSRTGQKSSTK